MNITIPKARKELAHCPIRQIPQINGERSTSLLWLDKNESIDPEYTEFIKTIFDDIPITTLYSYPDFYLLYQKLANYLQVEVEQLIFASGSDGVIRSVYEAFVSSGDAVIHPEPTYQMYSIYSKIYGAKHVVLNYIASDNGPILTIETILKAIKEFKPKLVCLPNPGSPTGTVFNSLELRQIITMTDEVGAVVLIDEAYYPFYENTVLPLISEYPHLIVSRSFSKAWGLAGLRLGYGISSKELMTELHKVRPRFEVTTLSAAVAERILDYPNVMLDSVKRLNDGKNFFLKEIRKLGFRALNSEGNFVNVAFDKHAQVIHKELANSVLYLKDFNHPALKGYSRFTTTTRELFVPIIDKVNNIVN